MRKVSSKKERILKIINDIRGFLFCGPSDDPDAQTAMCVGYNYLLIQLKRTASPFVPQSIVESLNNIEVEMNNIFSVYEASAEIDALLPDIEQIIQGLDESVSRQSSETEHDAEGSVLMITSGTSRENWEAIRSEYDISKKEFGKKINFVSGQFTRNVIFRDVEQAFVLASHGFSKPAVVLAGGVIEELLKQYLRHKNIPVKSKNFVDYIEICQKGRLLKSGISKLSDSVREFRNLVHISREKTKRHTLSKATAKGAVSSIFTIANDFQ